ncbi:MAG: TIGR03087 family PEP-CTERM/XrtA system glycosyltransferase [Acetobacteraceae bacterium]
MPRRLLFLAHRIPYPPDKGEKIRAWHMLERLARRWTVELGCLVDDPRDLEHVPFLRGLCAHVEARPITARWRAAARALVRARPGTPLSLGWFRDAALESWVRGGLREGRWEAAFVYSSSMAPYVMAPEARLFRVLDMVDVDSAKWAAYAAGAKPPLRQVWAREARTLLALERHAAAVLERTLFVSEEEANHFLALAPEASGRVDWVENGVDLARFDPARPWPSPFPVGAVPLVFTGTMNYRPNVEAVSWFAETVLPALQPRFPGLGFWIVGANPAPAVQALGRRPGVHVTGTVADVRPFLAHAAAAVAPLKIARGIQNKVLEAMAMARPVIASPQAFEGVRATPGRDLLVAGDAEATAAAVAAVLEGRHPGIGASGREAVRAGHDWSATLRRLDTLLPAEG